MSDGASVVTGVSWDAVVCGDDATESTSDDADDRILVGGVNDDVVMSNSTEADASELAS